MADKTGDNTEAHIGKHVPRFDFSSNLDPDRTQTATIKDLLAELNYEHTKSSSDAVIDACHDARDRQSDDEQVCLLGEGNMGG